MSSAGIQAASEVDIEMSSPGRDVYTETSQLVKCFLGEFTGLVKPSWKEKEAISTMKRVVGKLLEKHARVYNGR